MATPKGTARAAAARRPAGFPELPAASDIPNAPTPTKVMVDRLTSPAHPVSGTSDTMTREVTRPTSRRV